MGEVFFTSNTMLTPVTICHILHGLFAVFLVLPGTMLMQISRLNLYRLASICYPNNRTGSRVQSPLREMRHSARFCAILDVMESRVGPEQ